MTRTIFVKSSCFINIKLKKHQQSIKYYNYIFKRTFGSRLQIQTEPLKVFAKNTMYNLDMYKHDMVTKLHTQYSELSWRDLRGPLTKITWRDGGAADGGGGGGSRNIFKTRDPTDP